MSWNKQRTIKGKTAGVGGAWEGVMKALWHLHTGVGKTKKKEKAKKG